jgi:hypothetical protein
MSLLLRTGYLKFKYANAFNRYFAKDAWLQTTLQVEKNFDYAI